MTAGQPPPVLQIEGVSKAYGALRPLRIASLTVAAGERVSIAGVDAGAGELLVNLVTGAALPDTGEVRVFGASTAALASGDDWLVLLERFGIVSPRAVLLEGSTLEQNLALPFTLEIDPVPQEVAARVGALAARAGIDAGRWLSVQAGELPAAIRVRAHLARALALGPDLVIVEHPTVDVAAADRQALAADIAAVCAGGLTMLIITNDTGFAHAAATRTLELVPASGALRVLRKGWFSR